MRHLHNLGSQISVSLPTDQEGYIGRECPNEKCLGYFKIIPGTGLKDVTTCHCPYCGYTADQSEFNTRDQIEYATSVAIRKITDAVLKDLRSQEFEMKPKGGFGIGLSIKVKAGTPYPIHWYREKALETYIECSNCTLKYAVYGVFAFCPDCGQHNSLQILIKNLEVVSKMLDMSSSATGTELGKFLVDNALEDCVSSFDGFAREICRVNAQILSHPDAALKISFQDLARAREKVITLFKVDLTEGLSKQEWETITRAFQKRHLLAHKMGVVDHKYIQKSGDASSVVGRKIKIDPDEVQQVAEIVRKIAEHFVEGLERQRGQS